MEKAWYPTPEAVLINEIIPTLERAGIDPFDYDLQGILEAWVSVDYHREPTSGEPVYRFALAGGEFDLNGPGWWGMEEINDNYWAWRAPDGEVVRGDLGRLIPIATDIEIPPLSIQEFWATTEPPSRGKLIRSIQPNAKPRMLGRWYADNGVAPVAHFDSLAVYGPEGGTTFTVTVHGCTPSEAGGTMVEACWGGEYESPNEISYEELSPTDSPDSSPATDHTFMVSVAGCSPLHAQRVMSERIDERYREFALLHKTTWVCDTPLPDLIITDVVPSHEPAEQAGMEYPSLDAAFPTAELQEETAHAEQPATDTSIDEIMQLLKPAWLLPSTGVEK